jgi:hypothetical protein
MFRLSRDAGRTPAGSGSQVHADVRPVFFCRVGQQFQPARSQIVDVAVLWPLSAVDGANLAAAHPPAESALIVRQAGLIDGAAHHHQRDQGR